MVFGSDLSNSDCCRLLHSDAPVGQVMLCSAQIRVLWADPEWDKQIQLAHNFHYTKNGTVIMSKYTHVHCISLMILLVWVQY